MPAPRGLDRSLIEDALAALRDALFEAGAPWMVIGGIAVIAHGVQRMTTDIDAVVQGDIVETRKLLRVLRKHKILPRIDDAEAFAATNLVLLARHQPTQVDLDISFGWTAFEREALAARASTRYGTVKAPMARVEELLVFKAIAGRARDIDDAVTLLSLYPHIDLAEVRRRVIQLAELADAPELLTGLEAILRDLRPSPARAKTASKAAPPRPSPAKANEKGSAKKTAPAKKTKKR